MAAEAIGAHPAGATFELSQLKVDMRHPAGTVEAELAKLAAGQHGLVSRGQLLAAGVTAAEIRSRLTRGSLLRQHRGVYRVGHRAPSTDATYLAAVLAAGQGALLSGTAAAYLWRLLKGSAPPAEVIAATKRRIEGAKTHRSRHLDTRDVAVCRGIPVTTVPRTLVDVASVMTADSLARACHEAGVRYRTTPAQVEAALGRKPNARGARKLRRIIHGDVHVTLSGLERTFVELLRDERLPLPVTNRLAGGRRVDCRWPEHLLTVELDGYRFHNSRYSWEQDRRREREARARGDEFRRYSYADVMENRTFMLRELRMLLRS